MKELITQFIDFFYPPFNQEKIEGMIDRRKTTISNHISITTEEYFKEELYKKYL